MVQSYVLKILMELIAMAKITSQNKSEITIEVTIDLKGSIMEMENSIQDASNQMGALATEKALETFDTDGSPIQIGFRKMDHKRSLST